MAGIGFKLQKLLVEEMYLSLFQGFFYSLVITSGPWLMMVISLAVLSFFSNFFLRPDDKILFNILLVHVFSFSMIIIGVFQLFFTRIFADKLYEKQRSELPVVIMTNLACTLSVTVILITPFVWLLEIDDFRIKLLTYCLFLTMNILWVLMNYVSVSEDFLEIAQHYTFGSVLGVGLGLWWGYVSDLSGFMLGFFLGQAYVALRLMNQTISVFGFPERLDFSVFKSFHHYRIFLLSGFFLSTGLWIDKFIYWYGPSGERFRPLLYYKTGYDDIFYIAFLFTTPVMAMFFMSMETSFYRHYHAYNQAMVNKARLQYLRTLSDEIGQCIKNQLIKIIEFEGMVIILGILFSPQILKYLKLSPELNGVFNLILVGVFFHVLSLIICVILLYYDLRKETFLIYLGFLVLNGTLTAVTILLGQEYTGAGYMSAAILTFVYSLWHLRKCVKHIHYLSFTRRPMAEENLRELCIPETGLYGRYYLKDGKKLIDIT